MPDPFKNKQFEVEHALDLYASSFVHMPAFGIYEDEVVQAVEHIAKNCHIYLIGLVPRVNFVGCQQKDETLTTSFQVLGNRHDLVWPMEKGMTLAGDGETGWYVVNEKGIKSFPGADAMMARLSTEHHAQDFEVLYIGQAFGDDGSRHALDRLKQHETLQKISLQGIPEGYALNLLMLEIVPGNRMIMMFNPWANEKDEGEQRIQNGLDKLYDTNEAERTTLYEASLIRYFQPKYNKEFKNSFPSTSMKLLKDCYDKDIAAVVAEICFDDFPFRLFSQAVSPRDYHIAKHDLHDDAARKVFFG